MRHRVLIVVVASILPACGGSDADADRFCELLEELDGLDTRGLPPDQALVVMEQERDRLEEVSNVAPDEIRADVQLFAGGVLDLVGLQIAAGGDESQIDQADADALAEGVFTAEFDAASTNVIEWREANCD
jgi:hypothetical protein